jgi:phosphate transport system permease protein
MSAVQVDTTTTAPPAPPRRPELASKSSSRAAKDLIARIVMWTAFFVAVIPLVWILASVLLKGGQMLLESQWWTNSQAGITPRKVGGGAAHAIQGTLYMALVTAAMSVPIGVLTAVYLVE